MQLFFHTTMLHTVFVILGFCYSLSPHYNNNKNNNNNSSNNNKNSNLEHIIKMPTANCDFWWHEGRRSVVWSLDNDSQKKKGFLCIFWFKLNSKGLQCCFGLSIASLLWHYFNIISRPWTNQPKLFAFCIFRQHFV